MNVIAALNQLDTQIKSENLEVHSYTLFNKTIQVILLSSNELPSRPVLARGIAILSPNEEPSEEGVLWAAKRALNAYTERFCSEPIHVSRTRGKALFPRLLAARNAIYNGTIVFKSEYAPLVPAKGKARRIELCIRERLNRESLKQEVEE